MLKFNHVDISCNRTPILSDISCEIPKGKITVIVGPNGCGKTTLLQTLNGTSTVTAGQIFLEEELLLSLSSRERAKRIAFLPQVHTVIPAIKTVSLVEHGRFPYLGFARRKTEKDYQIIQQSMDLTHVLEYADQSVDTLSGGTRQRAFVSMVLAQDTEYIVMDEPTTYLDFKGQRNFLSLVKVLKEKGKTVILVLHDLTQALEVADYLIVMKDRKIAAQGTPKMCLEQHILEDIFELTIKTFIDEGGTYYIFR